VRVDGRKNDQIRETSIKINYLHHNKASVLIKMGNTSVLCAASLSESVPPFLIGKDKGWVTAEYSMLPSSTPIRNSRERSKISGRTQEIQRLIGRSLRAVIDLEKLGERTITIDCDVLEADGGTRTASITGGYIALALMIKELLDKGDIKEDPLTAKCAAISVGLIDNEILLDLCYKEDFSADVDMNIVMNDSFEFIEIQGTAEEKTFSLEDLNGIIAYAKIGIRRLSQLQDNALVD
jgi:ribonuclease PH